MASELARGVKVEHEHSATVGGSEPLMRKIAKDHLREDPTYYSKLAKVERKFKGKRKVTP